MRDLPSLLIEIDDAFSELIYPIYESVDPWIFF